MSVNPLKPFSCLEPPSRFRTALSRITVKAILDVSTHILLEMGDLLDLRLTLTFGGATITATGVEVVSELIDCFQLGDAAVVSCERSSLALVQDSDIVLCHDASSEVRIPRGTYDRLAALVTDLVRDRSVQDAFEETIMRLARHARATAWHPGLIEG